MKNSIYFDETFAPVLLVNEESDPNGTRNTIWLVFQTGDGSDPYLEINVKSVQYTVTLDAETSYNYQLAGLYWAVGGATSIRLVAGGVASEYIYITFPEIINTDAALQEIENTDRRYYIQGKDDIKEELKSNTIRYTNGRDYNIADTLQKIIEFVFASRIANTSALLTFTVLFTASGIEDETEVTVRIRVNRSFDEVFVPIQTTKNGKHVLTVCYPVLDIAQNDRNQIDVYMEIGEGTAEILEGQILASLTASGLAESGGFTGEIEVIDVAEDFTIDDLLQVAAATESVNIINRIPVGATISENAATLTIPNLTISDTLLDSVHIVNGGAEAKQRVTETGDRRITESGEYRYTEQEE